MSPVHPSYRQLMARNCSWGRAPNMGLLESSLSTRYFPRKALSLWGSAFLVLTLVLTILLTTGGSDGLLQRVDDAWHEFLQGHRSAFWLQLSLVLDWLGYTGTFIFQGLMFALLIRHHRWCALFIAFTTISSLVVNRVLKTLVNRERPEAGLIDTHTAAFPSGHAMATTAAVVTAGYVLRRTWIWITGACLTAMVMLSRTYLSVHWLSDVVTGFFLAAGMVTLFWLWCGPRSVQQQCRAP